MENNFEKFCLKIYENHPSWIIRTIIPVINIIKKINKRPKTNWEAKFGNINFPEFTKKTILIHGVSVGEIASIENLIRTLKEKYSDFQIVVTTGTSTGQEFALKKYSEIADFITFFPIDSKKIVQKFLNKINPSVIFILETEVWPNFTTCAKEKNIPIYLINARLSDKSYPSYLKFKKFIAPTLEKFDGVYCQSEIDKERYISIGALSEKTEVMRNLKFELAKKPCDIDLAQGENKILIAGSTHKGEDEIVIENYKKLKEKVKNLKLIIAPRHFSTIDNIKKILEKENISYGQRTKKDNFSNKDVVILDTIGELSKIYAIVDVAFIGGSFCKTGGHNPLEATVFDKPTITGPSIKNFRDIYSILKNDNASFVVQNKEEFYEILEKLFTDNDFYNQISINAKNSFEKQQGALDFILNKFENLCYKK